VSRAGCRLAEEYLPFGQPLAAAYARQAMAVDVGNAPYINGFSTKLFSCFAAGGFMLTSRKADLAGALGDLAEAIMFSSAEELSAKVNHFLGAPQERRNLTRQIQAVIREKFTASLFTPEQCPKGLRA
jgi:spore maturation protein CgeB